MTRLLSAIAWLILLPTWMGMVDGHGMILDPPGRSSLYRYGFNVNPNYDDNALNCGGYSVFFNFLLPNKVFGSSKTL